MKISLKKYAAALCESLFSEKKDSDEVQNKMQNFFELLRKRKQLKLLKRFYTAFSEVWNEKKGRLDVKVIYPYEPDDIEVKALSSALSQNLGKEVIMHVKVDEKVIGGFRLEFGEHVIDGTVKKNLEILKTKLVSSNNN